MSLNNASRVGGRPNLTPSNFAVAIRLASYTKRAAAVRPRPVPASLPRFYSFHELRHMIRCRRLAIEKKTANVRPARDVGGVVASPLVASLEIA
jgi:hypothetical protein